jgi:integral membrane protein
MFSLLTTKIGRLRLIGMLEGTSLLVLIGIAVPLKHVLDEPLLVRIMGPVHGLLFLMFVINTLSVGIDYRWKFSTTTWKVLVACLVPFGTFYIDRRILSKIPPYEQRECGRESE